MSLNRSFWKDRRVFLTGHTGFKGSWLSLWLSTLGAEVVGTRSTHRRAHLFTIRLALLTVFSPSLPTSETCRG